MIEAASSTKSEWKFDRRAGSNPLVVKFGRLVPPGRPSWKTIRTQHGASPVGRRRAVGEAAGRSTWISCGRRGVVPLRIDPERFRRWP